MECNLSKVVKRLTIEVDYFKNESHKIHIGNCEWLEFKSKRYVQDFIVAYKRMLIENVGCINNFRLQLLNTYYTNYFQFSTRTILKLDKKVATLGENFNWIFATYSEGNNNAFVLRSIDLFFQDLLEALDILKLHGQKHKNYMLKDQVKFLTRSIEDRMENFEKERRALDMNELSRDSKLIKLRKVEKESA